MAPTVGPRATESDLGVLLCSIAISLIPRYLLGEGPLLKEGWCLGQCSAGNPQVLPSMQVLLWHVPKLCCRPCWHFKGNIIPWCLWPLPIGPQIPPPKIRPDQIESCTWMIQVSGKWAKTVQGQLSQGEAGCISSVRLRTNFKNLFMLVIYGLFSSFGLCSHDFHFGLFKLDHLPAAVGALIQIAAI